MFNVVLTNNRCKKHSMKILILTKTDFNSTKTESNAESRMIWKNYFRIKIVIRTVIPIEIQFTVSLLIHLTPEWYDVFWSQ